MSEIHEGKEKIESFRERLIGRFAVGDVVKDVYKRQVPYSAGGSQALGIASAQQRRLAAMLRDPHYIDLVQGQLTAEQFVLPQQKELFEAMPVSYTHLCLCCFLLQKVQPKAGCSPEKGCGRGVERKSAHKSLLHFEICI